MELWQPEWSTVLRNSVWIIICKHLLERFQCSKCGLMLWPLAKGSLYSCLDCDVILSMYMNSTIASVHSSNRFLRFIVEVHFVNRGTYITKLPVLFIKNNLDTFLKTIFCDTKILFLWQAVHKFQKPAPFLTLPRLTKIARILTKHSVTTSRWSFWSQITKLQRTRLFSAKESCRSYTSRRKNCMQTCSAT